MDPAIYSVRLSQSPISVQSSRFSTLEQSTLCLHHVLSSRESGESMEITVARVPPDRNHDASREQVGHEDTAALEMSLNTFYISP